MDTVTCLIPRKSLWFISLLVLASVLMLSACGNALNTSTGSNASTPTPAPTISASQAHADGCPSRVIVNKLPPANITLKSSNINKGVSTSQGDIIEVDLAFGHTWQNPILLPQGLLTMQSTAGDISPTAKACIWRFTATGTGVAHINFTGRPICATGRACPLYILAIPFTVEIK